MFNRKLIDATHRVFDSEEGRQVFDLFKRQQRAGHSTVESEKTIAKMIAAAAFAREAQQ